MMERFIVAVVDRARERFGVFTPDPRGIYTAIDPDGILLKMGCVHTVTARDGDSARAKAIREHRACRAQSCASGVWR